MLEHKHTAIASELILSVFMPADITVIISTYRNAFCVFVTDSV